MPIPAGDPNLTPDPRDVVELSFGPPEGGPGGAGTARGPDVRRGPGPEGGAGRGFLRLWFSCAGQYARAYKDRAGTGYIGRCPKCSACVRFGIGAGGTSRRQFEVSCSQQ